MSEWDEKWLRPVTELAMLSVRAYNCLQYEDAELGFYPIRTVFDLVQNSEQRLLRRPNIGRKTLAELKEALATEGLYLEMPVPVRPSATLFMATG